MDSTMKFGAGTGRNQKISDIVGHAKTLEELGYDHLTFIDSQNLSRDTYVMLTIAALETSRIKLGHGVTNPFTRHWAVTANATATIHELSGSRAFVGIGPGMSSVGALGMKPRSMKQLRESVESIREFVSGRTVTYNDSEVHSEWSRERVPIFIGSDGPKSMSLAGQIGDGVVCPSVDPTIFQYRLDIIRRGAESVGRDPNEVEVWARTMCFISDSKEEARRQTRSYAATCAEAFYFSNLARDTKEREELQRRLDPELLADITRVHESYDMYEHELINAPHAEFVTDRVMDAFILTGTPDDVIAQISALRDVGVRTVSMVDYTLEDKLGMMREFASSVMPAFQVEKSAT